MMLTRGSNYWLAPSIFSEIEVIHPRILPEVNFGKAAGQPGRGGPRLHLAWRYVTVSHNLEGISTPYPTQICDDHGPERRKI